MTILSVTAVKRGNPAVVAVRSGLKPMTRVAVVPAVTPAMSIETQRIAAASTDEEPIPRAIGIAAPYAAEGPLIAGTSKTTNSIDTVIDKTFRIEEFNRSFFPGTRLRATAVGFDDVWLEGIVTAWDGQNVTIDGDLASGTGTYHDWQINVAGEPGIDGEPGSPGPPGPSGGPVGPQGPPGTPGSVWRNGVGAPPDSLGVDGDYYLDDTSDNVWLRGSSHSYSVVANIGGTPGAAGPEGPPGADSTVPGPQGPPGATWYTGVGAPPNSLGVDGDYYLDDVTNNVWHKSAGTYSVVANLGGPAGPPGADSTVPGPQGPAGPAGATGSQGPAGATGPQGVNAYTATTGSFTVPAVGSTVTVNVTDASWIVVGQFLWIGTAGGSGNAGPLQVTAKAGNQLTLLNPYPSDLSAYATLASPVFVGDPRAPTPSNPADNDTSIATTAFVQAAVAAALAASPGWTTGDAKLTLKTVADAGWILADDGTIGDASSTATTRKNADTQALFTLLWNNVNDTNAPVSGGRGANAAADFAAHKTIALTKQLGRALAIGGAGSGLTSRLLGATLGEETHTPIGTELASHTHAAATGVGLCQYYTYVGVSGAQVDYYVYQAVGAPYSSVTVNAAGGGSSFNVMQPTAFWNVMIKL